MATVRTIQVRISSNSASYIGALKKAENATRQFNTTVNNTARAAAGNSRATKSTTAGYAGMSRGAKSAMNSVQRLGGAMYAGNKAMNAVYNSTGKLGKAFAGLKSVGISAVASLAGFWAIHTTINLARQSVDFLKTSVLDFNQAMTESTAIMGDLSQSQRDQLESAAKYSSTISTFTPAETAEGLYFLASAGFSADQALRLLPISAKFAQAGVMDLEKATESLTDIQKAVSGSYLDAEAIRKKTVLYDPTDIKKTEEGYKRVADVVTQTAVASNATIAQVADGLTGKLGPQLRVLNKDIEEGAAILAVYANVGIKGKVASTAAAMALRDLQTRAIKNPAIFKQLGVEVFNASGQMNKTADIIEDLQNALSGLSDEEKRATLLQMGFQDRSLGALLALVGFADEIRQFDKELRKSKGTVDEISNKQLKSFNAQIKLVSNNLRVTAIDIGKFLESGVKKLASILAPAFVQVNKAVQAIWKNFKPFAEIVGKIVGGAVLATFTAFSKVLEFSARAAQKLSGPIALLLSYLATTKIIIPATTALFSSLFGMIKTGFISVSSVSSAFFKGFAAKSQGFSILPVMGRTMPQGLQKAAAAGEKSFRALQIIMTPVTASFRLLSSAIDFFSIRASLAFNTFKMSAQKAFDNSRIVAFGKGFVAASQGIQLSGIGVSQSLQNAADAGGRAFQSLANAPKAFMASLKGFGPNVKAFMANPILNSQMVFGAFTTRIKTSFIPAVKNIGTNIKTFGSNAKNSFGNLRTNVSTAITQMIVNFKTLDFAALRSKFSFSNLKLSAIADFLSIELSAEAMAATVSFAVSAMTAGLTVGLMVIPMIIQSFQSAKAAAQEFAQEMVAPFSTTSYKEQGEAIDVLQANLVDLRAETAKHDTDMPGLIFEALIPFDVNENVKALHEQQEAELQLAQAQERRTNIVANAVYVNNEHGRSLQMDGEEFKAYTARVGAAAEKAGIDLTRLPKDSQAARDRIAVILRQQTNDFRMAGYGPEELANMTEEEMDAAVEAVQESAKEVDKSLADMFDPSKAYEEAKAFTDSINKAFKTPEQVFSDYKSNLEKQARAAFDAAQKVAEEEAKKNKKDYERPDFNFNANIGATEFLKVLQGQSKLVEAQRERMRQLVALGASPEFIEGLQQLGDDALPIMQEITSMSAAEAKRTVEAYNAEFAKFGEIPAIDINQFSASMAKRAAAARGAVNSATQLIAMGFDPGQIQEMLKDPQLAQVLSQMYFEIMSLPPELRAQKIAEFKQVTQDVYDSKNVETNGITEAMRMAMEAALQIATDGSADVVQAISTAFSKAPDEVYKIFKMLEAQGIDVPGFDPNQAPPSQGGPGAPPAAGGKGGGTAAPKPDKNSGPNPPIGREMAVKETKDGRIIKIGMRDKYKKPKGWKKGDSPNGKFVKKGTYWIDEKGFMHRVGYFADGGVENHTATIAKGGVRVWAEPETGGEAYIPLGMNKRAKSSQILEQVAQQFGYGLVKYANGGFFGTAGSQMVGGGQFGTSNGQAVQTVVVPVQSKNETNFNGPIVGVNMEDAVRFAEQKKRQKALTR